MTPLPHLRDIFDQLTRGVHLSPEDEPMFSALAVNFSAYAEYFSALGVELVANRPVNLRLDLPKP